MKTGNHDDSRKKLKIDLAELTYEMDQGNNSELSAYLDTKTGEIISIPGDVLETMEDEEEDTEDLPKWERELIETAKEVFDDDKGRFLAIPRRESHEGYGLMASFATTVNNKQLGEKLNIALNGKGAFRHFRNVLNEHPDELERWYAFKDEYTRNEAIQWLLSNGIESV